MHPNAKELVSRIHKGHFENERTTEVLKAKGFTDIPLTIY